MSANKHTNKLKLQNYAYEVSDTGVFTHVTSGSNVYFQPFTYNSSTLTYSPTAGHGEYSLIEAIDVDWRPYKVGNTPIVTSYDLIHAIETEINDTASSLEGYLPLAGGTMSGKITWTGASQEILRFGGDNASWRSGLKYSWATNTTIGFWGKHKMTQFVWNAGTDFSTADINGTTTKTYDFQVGRDDANGDPIGRIGGNIIWHEGNDGPDSGLNADLLDNLHASDFALAQHTHDSLDIVPIKSKTYGENQSLYGINSAWDNTTWYFFSLKPNSATDYWHIKYKIKVVIPYDPIRTTVSIVDYYGYGINCTTYKIWNDLYTGYASYYHAVYWLTSTGFINNYGHAIGLSIRSGTNYTTAAWYRTMQVDLLGYEGCTVEMFDTPKKWSEWEGSGWPGNGSGYGTAVNYARGNTTPSTYNATSTGLQETGDANDTSTIYLAYTRLAAGANGMKMYSLIMEDGVGKWQSFTTTSGTGTAKTKNTSGFRLGSKIYYLNRGDLAANAVIDGNNQVAIHIASIDFRYSFNNITSNNSENGPAVGLTAYKPLYVVGTINETDKLFYLDDNWWTQEPSASSGNKIYIKVCEGVRLANANNINGQYSGDLISDGDAYWFKNGKLVKYEQYVDNADTLDGHDSTYFATAESLGDYLPLAGGEMDNGATIKLTSYGERFLTISGNNISHDLTNASGGYAGSFYSVSTKDSGGQTSTFTGLGFYGGRGQGTGLYYLYAASPVDTYLDPTLKLTPEGYLIIKRNITAAGFKTPSGTSSQFLKADGSVDSNTYSTTSHNHDSVYVKFNPGAAEQTIQSGISTLSKGVINLWRNNGDYYTFLGFSNGTTETYLGGIGFKSQSDKNLYHKDGANYYKIGDENNDGTGSGLDADLLDGYDSTYFAPATSLMNYVLKTGDTMTGPLTIASTTYGNYNEGIRLTRAANNWVGITFGSTGTSGPPSNGWFAALNPSNQFIIGTSSTTSTGLCLNAGGDMLWRNSKVWTEGNDGPDSGLNADLLDGLHATDIIGSSLNRLRRANLNVSSTTSGMIPPDILGFKNGYPLYTDPEFKDGNNSILVYNNAGGTAVTVTRITDNQASGNSSGYILKVHSSSTNAGPGGGGWYFATQGISGHSMVCLFRAKVPENYTLRLGSNSIGTGGTGGWLTENTGTGKWEWYAYLIEFGTNPTTTFFWYLTPAGNVDWYLSYANVIDITKANYDGLRTRFADAATSATQVVVRQNISSELNVPLVWSNVGNTQDSTSDQLRKSYNDLYWNPALKSFGHGDNVSATGIYSHAEGAYTQALEECSHAEGYGTVAKGYDSHAEGSQTEASGGHSHAEGRETYAVGRSSHSEGENTVAQGYYSHAEGHDTHAVQGSSHAEGIGTTAEGLRAHAEGWKTTASGNDSHSEGTSTIASGEFSHAEGHTTKSIGHHTHAEGELTEARGDNSHAEGRSTLSNGLDSHAEGFRTQANGRYSHSEGFDTVASGFSSHAEGHETTASGSNSHAEGYDTNATGDFSLATGRHTITNNTAEAAFGSYNISNVDNEDNLYSTAFSVGGGTAEGARKNLFEITREGKIGINKTLPSAVLDIYGIYDKALNFDTAANEYRLPYTNVGTINLISPNIGTGTSVNNGYATGMTFGYSNRAIAGIYSQMSFSYGSRLIFTTTNNVSYQYPRMIINHAGYVGIGTMTPSYKLHVNGTGCFEDKVRINSAFPQLDLHSTSAEASIYFRPSSDSNTTWAAGRGVWGVGGFGIGVYGDNCKFTILDNGNTGIGTNSPSYKLHVNGTFSSSNFGYRDSSGKNCNNVDYTGIQYYNSNGPATSIGASTGDGALYSQAYSSALVAQIAQDYRNGQLFVRGKNNGSWQSWRRILDSVNSSVSGGGNTVGSSLTVKINGTEKTLTIPASNETDHYTPSENSSYELSETADSTTDAVYGTTAFITGVTIKRDSKGHVVDMEINSARLPGMGSGSGLDADTLDGHDSTYFAPAASLLNYLPLAGGTMTGTIKRVYSASNQTPMLTMHGIDYDNYLWTISSSSASKYYGFGLLFHGEGTGNGNSLRLIADNQNGTDVIAVEIDQAGKIDVAKQIESKVAQGTAPFKVASTTKVDKLNADLLDGMHASEFATVQHTHDSLDIVPIESKTYEGTTFYGTGENWDSTSRYFFSLRPDSSTGYWHIKYKIKIWVPADSSRQTTSIVEYFGYGNTITVYKIWNTILSGYAAYYQTVYLLNANGYSNGYGHAIGVSILYGTYYTTAAWYRHMQIDLLEYEGCTVTMLDTPKKWSEWPGSGYTSGTYGTTANYARGNSSPSTYNITSNGLQESSDNDTTATRRYYTRLQAGVGGMMQYSLVMQDNVGRWQSFTTTQNPSSVNDTNTTSKTKNTAGFRLGSRIYYMNMSGTVTNGNFSGHNTVYEYIDIIDLRYSLNITKTSGNPNNLLPRKPVYIVGTIGNDELFYLDDVWWTQTEPTTEDDKIYIKVCESTYADYENDRCYRGDLLSDGVAYWYKNGKFVKYEQYANKAIKLDTARTLTIGNTGHTFDGSADVTWTLDEIGASGSTHNHDDRYLKLTGGTMSNTNLVTKLNADMVDGLHVHTGRNNETNKIVRTDVNGYLQVGLISTVAAAPGNTLTKIYCSDDDYIRYVAPSVFFPAPTNDNNQISFTIGSQNRKLTVAYATNADTVDGKHAAAFALAGHTHSSIVTEGDNRAVATTPNEYSNIIKFRGLKNNAAINYPSSTTYNYLIGLRGWGDSSGGKSHELAFNDNGIFRRVGSTTTWDAWLTMLDSSNSAVTGDGGSTWGSSITVKLNNISKTLTIPQSENNETDHYAPNANTNATLYETASSSTDATWGLTSFVTGLTINRDSKGHVVSISLESAKLPISGIGLTGINADTLDGYDSTYFAPAASLLNYLPLNGGQMKGPLTWKNNTALPEQTAPEYFLSIDAFASGGTTKWVSILNTQKALGIKNSSGGDVYLPLAGGTMTGLITTTSGANHRGLKVGDTYINAINGNLILQNNASIRFGGDGWDYNIWAGLNYAHSTKIISLGLADGTTFTANTAQSGGKIYTPGIDNIYIGRGTYKVLHTNDYGHTSGGTGINADLLDGQHASYFVTKSTDETITGQKNFNTATNTKPVIISRLGSSTVEALKIGVNDSQAYFEHVQDEAVSDYIFKGTWSDTESGNNNGGSKQIRFALSSSDHNIYVGSNKVIHKGDYGHTSGGTGINADMVDGKHASDFATSNHNHGASKTIWGQSLTDASGNIQDVQGTLSINGTQGSYTEGIRIHESSTGWTSIVLCGSNNTGNNGTSDRSWSMHTYNAGFYLNRNGSSAQQATRLWGHSNGFTIGNTNVNANALNVGGTVYATTDVVADGDVRAKGNDVYIGSASGSQCHQQYDATNQCLKFVFD